MLENIEWLFFDIGSTLIDETECYKERIQKTLKQQNSPSENEFLKAMNELANLNQEPYKAAIKKIGLQKEKWNIEKEKLYPYAKNVLETLKTKYKLGIIANQPIACRKKLENMDLTKYFDIIILSEEIGISKPEHEIFNLAIRQSNTKPINTIMIGDRLDNDIIPAQKLGMKTIWLKQGYGALGNKELLEKEPDFEIKNLNELIEILI